MMDNDYAKTARQRGMKVATPSLRCLIRQHAKGVRTFLYNLQSPRLKRTMFRLALAVPGIGEMYCALATPFRREIRAVLHGCLCYLQQKTSPTDGSPLLRRNIHRIEKGMIMRPRRSLFAVEFIGQTVECFESLALSVSCEQSPVIDELLWARGVLTKYFSIVDPHPKVVRARKLFESIKLPEVLSTEAALDLTPSLYQQLPKPSVTAQALHELVIARHSVRWFLPKALDRKVIDRAIDIARHAPSACNRQPFVFRVFDDPALVRQVAKIPTGTGGYADNIPCMVVIVGRHRAFGLIRSRHTLYVDGSLAAMAFVFALESLGVQSCFIVWPDKAKKDRRISKLLSLQLDERVIVCCAIGYADPEGMVANSTKKSVEQLRRYNLE